MPDPIRLAPGDHAPKLDLVDEHGAPHSLADHRGRRVVVFFYPAAMTPACSAEACDFRDSWASLAATGIDVIGVSPDAPAKLLEFRDLEGLNFPLLSDPEHRTIARWGAWGPKINYGRTYDGVIRSTFVVGATGRIEQALYNVKATGHVARLRKLLAL